MKLFSYSLNPSGLWWRSPYVCNNSIQVVTNISEENAKLYIEELKKVFRNTFKTEAI